jgi:hypothetical protein
MSQFLKLTSFILSSLSLSIFLPLININIYTRDSLSTPFKYYDWNVGNLLFEFIKYDPNKNYSSELQNFQNSNRILMIIGLINFPELGEESVENSNYINDELDKISNFYPSIIIKRFFIFNFSFDLNINDKIPSIPVGTRGDPDSVVIFPPDGIYISIICFHFISCI